MAQFRTKARAVELLGKGQIADLPTAITELWKNGYDAYADKVTAQIYLAGYKDLDYNFFVMTDDGKGMSKSDIFEKWLVLGTDSKSRIANQDIEGIETLWKKPRIKAGEKGIGRLSVAFLGSPMLMLTKKMGFPLQAMYFDWRLLENYNLFLDDVIIPTRDITSSSSISSTIEELKEEFLSNFNSVSGQLGERIWLNEDLNGNIIWESEQLNLKERIINSTLNLKTPSFFNKEIIEDLLEVNEAHGTKFITFEPEEQILGLIELNAQNEEDNENDIDFVLKSLSGFVNEFKNDKLPLNIEFPIHRVSGFDYDLLQRKWKFFEPLDFDLGDILIDGEFDGKGGFKGSIKLYNDEPFNYDYISSRKKDRRNEYGSFHMRFGYLMGYESESKLEGDQYTLFNKKINNLGGLYIYRDGFRVLPYGRQNEDFLEFENRRSKRAGTYFFGYVRMFGYIELTRAQNRKLNDKASREGLIKNAAYLAFKEDLIGFFVDIAKEYFATVPKNTIFLDKTAIIKEQAEVLKKDKEREKIEKNNFSRGLKEYPDRFNQYQHQYQSLLSELNEKVNQTNILYSDIEGLLDEIKNLDIGFKELLPKVPKRYKPTETQIDRLYKYEAQLMKFIDNTKANSADLMEQVQEKLEIKELVKEFEKAANRYKSNLQSTTHKAKEILDTKIKFINKEFSERVNRFIEELEKFKAAVLPTINSKEEILVATSKIAEIYEFQNKQIESSILPLVEHINRLSFDLDEETLQGAYKEQYESIKYQWEQTRETAQLGIAVEIIDHEFNEIYSRINQTIKRLDQKFDFDLFESLKTSFIQLEVKYALLSPLYRISGVVPKDISGNKLYEYLLNFFDNKFKEDGICLEATESFKNHIIFIREPIIHTVLINIVNNANYWMRNSETKKIILDYNDAANEILIINSGEKIPENRIEKIFELFYSNRPNGRGIGLYLSKQSLAESYFEIFATNDKQLNRLNGACFIIKALN